MASSHVAYLWVLFSTFTKDLYKRVHNRLYTLTVRAIRTEDTAANERCIDGHATFTGSAILTYHATKLCSAAMDPKKYIFSTTAL